MPNVRKFLVSGLQTGLNYGFTVQALNFNGPSLASNPSYFIVCTVPSALNPIVMSSVTRTSMTLEWAAPKDDGGCPIQSYSIF